MVLLLELRQSSHSDLELWYPLLVACGQCRQEAYSLLKTWVQELKNLVAKHAISLASALLEPRFRLPHSVSMLTLSQAFATPTSWDSYKWDLVTVRCIPEDDPFFKDRHCCDEAKYKLSVMFQNYSNGFMSSQQKQKVPARLHTVPLIEGMTALCFLSPDPSLEAWTARY